VSRPLRACRRNLSARLGQSDDLPVRVGQQPESDPGHGGRRLDDPSPLGHGRIKGSGDILHPDEERYQGLAVLQWADTARYCTLDSGVDVAVTRHSPVGECPPEQLSEERPRPVRVC
jgi:hypothetical protein